MKDLEIPRKKIHDIQNSIEKAGRLSTHNYLESEFANSPTDHWSKIISFFWKISIADVFKSLDKEIHLPVNIRKR